MTSFGFLRLIAFLQAGQLPFPRSLFFSEAIRARVKHSWQKMWPVSTVSSIHSHHVSHHLTTDSRSRIGIVLQANNASPLPDLHHALIFVFVRLLHCERVALLGLEQLCVGGGRFVFFEVCDVHSCC
jgi:hypothetical protein